MRKEYSTPPLLFLAEDGQAESELLKSDFAPLNILPIA
jgi:hypothetical protein